MLTAINIAWAAGFIEGEGHVGGQRNTVMPKITACQVQKEPLERLHKMFGGGIYLIEAQVANGRNNQQKWVWFLSGPKAVEVCLTLYILLSPKRRQQVDAALLRWRTSPIRKRNNSNICINGHLIEGDNARVAARYGGKPYKRCKQCEVSASRAQHARERRGRELVGRPIGGATGRGVNCACVICGTPFSAMRRGQKCCSRKCRGAERTRQLKVYRHVSIEGSA